VSPPWDTLRETIDARGWSAADLAGRAGISLEEIDRVLAGSTSITPEFAAGLERALDVPARFWLNRERGYRESLEKKPARIPAG
jgi:HTH-type transcriptional regulator/antitoxin HigA